MWIQPGCGTVQTLAESDEEANRLKVAEQSAEDRLAAAQSAMAALQAQLAVAQPELAALRQGSQHEIAQLKADLQAAEKRAQLCSQQVTMRCDPSQAMKGPQI